MAKHEKKTVVTHFVELTDQEAASLRELLAYGIRSSSRTELGLDNLATALYAGGVSLPMNSRFVSLVSIG